MKRFPAVALTTLMGAAGMGAACVCLLLGWQPLFAQQKQDEGKVKEKILAVGKDGIKIKGKLTNEAKNVPYAVRMEEGKTYQIRLNSKNFDAYLFVKDDKGKQLDYDDDSGGGTNSFLEFRAPANAVFVIIATSLGMGETGDYEFSVTWKP